MVRPIIPQCFNSACVIIDCSPLLSSAAATAVNILLIGLGNTCSFSVPALCEWVCERRKTRQEWKACRGCNRCPAVFCSAVPDQLYQSVQNKVSVCEPASVQCWLAAGPWWWWRLISQYMVERCHTGTKASGGKCCGLLCVWCISFACRIFSSANLQYFPYSSPLACAAIPFNLLPEGRSVPPSDQFAVESLAQDQAEEDRTNLTSKSEAGSREAAAAAGEESGFYHHTPLLWWGILSNGNFFLTGGVIAFSLWTPLYLQTLSHQCIFVGLRHAHRHLVIWVQFSFMCHILRKWQNMLLTWMHVLWLSRVSRHLRSQNPFIDLNRRHINDDTSCHVVPVLWEL